ncbi:MAG: glutamate-cysteine ligase family protein, partial [Solirubrobacterales bacterium]
MLIDAESLELTQGIETILGHLGEEFEGRVKPELLQSVLEIATVPHPSVTEATEELRSLRETVGAAAERNSMRVAASGTHPSALWEDQKIVNEPRYQ